MQTRRYGIPGIHFWISSRKDGSTVKKLLAVFILGAFFLSVGVGCGGPSTTSKSTTTIEKKDEKKEKP